MIAKAEQTNFLDASASRIHFSRNVIPCTLVSQPNMRLAEIYAGGHRKTIAIPASPLAAVSGDVFISANCLSLVECRLRSIGLQFPHRRQRLEPCLKTVRILGVEPSDKYADEDIIRDLNRAQPVVRPLFFVGWLGHSRSDGRLSAHWGIAVAAKDWRVVSRCPSCVAPLPCSQLCPSHPKRRSAGCAHRLCALKRGDVAW